ncbi:serine/threonine protein phosphatase [Nodosilinea sp. LEGE 06152]|uniref:metallophosphoesterase n=1 Tax=Nodosilinea sp. LEGE 06152 TaxID=2777966 RepID=UPI001881437C|nr:metallophosphoesterase [Nodosilinea sp. LEGE 06152]MBE9159207.1 serine/threonine protein phosphatase [Nodosilinea sp. LEGE 06152]
MPRRIFIGDIHGHYDGLQRLWDAIAPETDDEIYCVGDLIDRGPKSADVVDFVRRHATNCVRGNHEQLILDTFVDGKINPPTLQGWIFSGGQATLTSYHGSASTLEDHLDWLRQLPLYIDLGDLWLVHAGVNPMLPIAEQSSYEMCWIRETFHSSLTPFFSDKLIITGHTITFTFPGVDPGQIVAGRGWIDIDTGVYHPRSGWLTALDWDNQIVYQVNVFEPIERVRSCAEAITYLDPTLIKKRPRDMATRAAF